MRLCSAQVYQFKIMDYNYDTCQYTTQYIYLKEKAEGHSSSVDITGQTIQGRVPL